MIVCNTTQHNNSSYLSTTGYPASADPPSDQTPRKVFALAGQEEPVVLSSNVQSSNTGQVKVMWHFAGTAGSNMYSPNSDKNSLVLTTANNGDYFPQVMVTSSSLQLSSTNSDSEWANLFFRLKILVSCTTVVCWHAFMLYIRRLTTIHEEFNL